MAVSLKVKRGTRAQIDAAAAVGGLIAGEPYLITDEDRLAVGLSTTAYATGAKQSHNHTLGDVTDSGAMAGYAEATAAQMRGLTASPLGVTTQKLRDAAALITPSGASNWTPDWSAFVSADWNVTENRTINNPTNVIPGTTRVVKIRANSTTARTITFGTNYKGNVPTATVTNDAFLFVTMTAFSSTEIVLSHLEYS